jgi:uncharacterized protein YdeI (YjbR/CyaY-like superfamily)
MATTDPRIDAYIQRAAPYAQPILKRIRAAFRTGCPQLEETIKWGNPVFMHHGILGGMAAFKQHVSFSFWRGTQVGDPKGILTKIGDTLMSQAKIGSIAECPTQAVLVAYVKRAVKANEAAAKAGRIVRKQPARAVPKTPADLAAAFQKHKAAKATFDAFAPSHKREYLEWILEAKKPETRARRIVQAIAMMAAGKSRNWKYERPKAGAAKKASPKTTKKAPAARTRRK